MAANHAATCPALRPAGRRASSNSASRRSVACCGKLADKADQADDGETREWAVGLLNGESYCEEGRPRSGGRET